MWKRAALIVVAVLAGSLARAEDWNKTFTLSGRPVLRVDAKDGAVTVRAWDQSTIAAHVSAPGWKIGPGELEIVDHQTGDAVDLTLRRPPTHWGVGSRAVRIDIQAPRNTRLDIRTGDGSIRVFEVGGEMRLVTGDGGIEANGVEGVVQARTGDGSVHIRGRLESLALHTGDGGIEVNAMPGSRLASAWKIQTGDGSVVVRLPSDLAADLDVHTGDGSLRVDLPVAETQKDKRSVRGKLNGGGPTLSIRTGDGSVRVDRI